MAFPWFTLIMWVLSFFLSKNAGMSNGKAALLATGAAAATYVVADPANKKNLLGIGVPKNDTKTPPEASAEGAEKYQINAGAIDPAGEDAPKPKQQDDVDKQRDDSDGAVAGVLGTAITTAGGVAETVVTKSAEVATSFGPDGIVKTAVGLEAAEGVGKGIGDAAQGVGGVLKDPQTSKILLFGGLGVLALMMLK